MSSFGAGLGPVIGSSLGAGDLSAGLKSVNNTADGFGANTAGPYNGFGQSANSVTSHEDFAKGFTGTDGAKYQMGVADAAQNNSAAAKGGLLSGANLRSLDTINQGIASTDLNQAYDQYLKGNSQQFGQLQSVLGDMFQGIGVGTTATGQIAGVDNAQIGATSQIAQAQAKNDQSKGSGIGSLFSGLGSILPGVSAVF
jgi:hypothetical protein